METRKKTRKAFPYSRKILQIFQNAQCREFTVNITPLDSATLEKAKPLSESEIARILESDTESSLTNKTLSPRTENRLREKENGMVLLPRSSYNEHPARKVLFESSRSTRSKGSTSKNKNSPRDRTSHKSRSPAKHTKHSASHTARSDSTSLGRGKRHKEVSFKLKSGKPSFDEKSPKSKQVRPIKKTNGVKLSTNNNEKEYQIVLCDPINKSKKQETDIEKLSLSELLNTEQLPSKLWEVERVPPLMVNTKSDITYNTIAAELDALMADDEPEAMEVDTNQDVPKPSEIETPSTETVILKENDHQNVTEDIKNELSDDVEMTVVSDEKIDALETKDTLENKDTSETSEEATEDKKVNTSPESDNTETSAQPETACTLPNEETKESEEIIETKNEDTNLDNVENVAIDHSDTKDENISSEIKSDKITEEFPSIMDLLNEQPSTDLEETKEEQADNSQQKPDAEIPQPTQDDIVIDDPKPIPTDACESSINLPEEFTKNNIEAESKDTSSSNGIITSVIFRRFSSDKQTYDRLVIFQSDLEYTVKINNKEVELLGAPRYMTSTEDLQILLQIVDEVSLDSFNVICKS